MLLRSTAVGGAGAQFLLVATGIGFDFTVRMFQTNFPDDCLSLDVPVVLFGSVRRYVRVLVVFVGTSAGSVGQPRFFVSCPHFCTMAIREFARARDLQLKGRSWLTLKRTFRLPQALSTLPLHLHSSSSLQDAHFPAAASRPSLGLAAVVSSAAAAHARTVDAGASIVPAAPMAAATDYARCLAASAPRVPAAVRAVAEAYANAETQSAFIVAVALQVVETPTARSVAASAMFVPAAPMAVALASAR